MSRRSRIAQLSGTPYRRTMRSFLDRHVPLHSDLDAFCIDHCPELTRRFGDGWDLLSKQSLLIMTVPPDQLLSLLTVRFESDPQALHDLANVKKHLSQDELMRQSRSEELERLCISRASLVSEGRQTHDLDVRIRELKRHLREYPQLQEGEILSERYRLLCLLGKGGFSRVYEAYDVWSQQLVAVKVLHSESSDDPSALSRFERGARQMQQLNHKNIVRVLDGPSDQDGFHYFVMECLRGGDLAQAIKNSRLGMLDKLRVVLEVGAALRHAHECRLVHRDVKPENVLLDNRLSAKLTDFDLVWAADTTGGTRSRAGLGTYLYAATEQLTDASSVTPSADIYGLAMLTYFILAGSVPAWFREFRQHAISSLPVNQPLQRILDRATNPSPEHRPPLLLFLQTVGQCWPLTHPDDITARIRLLRQQDVDSSGAHASVAATEVSDDSTLPPVGASLPIHPVVPLRDDAVRSLVASDAKSEGNPTSPDSLEGRALEPALPMPNNPVQVLSQIQSVNSSKKLTKPVATVVGAAIVLTLAMEYIFPMVEARLARRDDVDLVNRTLDAVAKTEKPLDPSGLSEKSTALRQTIRWKVVSEPSGAKVATPDGKELGKTPWTDAREQEVGIGKVRLELDGYASQDVFLDLKENNERKVRLQRAGPRTKIDKSRTTPPPGSYANIENAPVPKRETNTDEKVLYPPE